MGTTSNNRVYIPTPLSYAKKNILDSTYKKWGEQWASSKIGRHAKFWFPKPDKNLSKHFLKQSRVELGHQIQMLSGFNRLNYFESKISGIDPTCRLCLEDEETAYHIISECPALWALRQKCFNTLPFEKPTDWKPHQLQSFLKSSKIIELNSGMAIEHS